MADQTPHYAAVVVGTGFGGSMSALALALRAADSIIEEVNATRPSGAGAGGDGPAAGTNQ